MSEEVNTVVNDEGHWAESLVGDNAERLEALKSFETPDAFFNAYDEAANKDWRKEIAGDDDKFLSNLQRFENPVAFGNSFREAQQTIRSGQLQKPLAEGATEEDIKAYREANGIPLEPAGYLQNLPEGLVIGEDDKEILGDFMGVLHSKNVAPDVAHEIIGWYNQFAENEQAALAEMDEQQLQETTDQLRQDWGSDYRANINLVNGLLSSTFGEEAAKQLINGRFGDGRAFMNDPAVLQGLAALARKVNPVAQLTGNQGDPTMALNDEISQLEKYMRENRTAYNSDEKAQARLRELYEIRIQQGNAA